MSSEEEVKNYACRYQGTINQIGEQGTVVRTHIFEGYTALEEGTVREDVDEQP